MSLLVIQRFFIFNDFFSKSIDKSLNGILPENRITDTIPRLRYLPFLAAMTDISVLVMRFLISGRWWISFMYFTSSIA